MSQSEARSRCAPTLAMTDKACSVGEFGRVGAIAGHEFFYARYDYRDVRRLRIFPIRASSFSNANHPRCFARS